MKKRFLFITGAKRWNSLLRKFTKLHKKLQLLLDGNMNTKQYKKLLGKLQGSFSKLEKMQYRTGIKVAGTSLAILLSTYSTVDAQFGPNIETLRSSGSVYAMGYSALAFEDLDGDGDKDMYLGSTEGRVILFDNDNGIYTESVLLSSGTPFTVGANASPVFADIDGDGDKDLYVGTEYGYIRTFLNVNGTLENHLSIQVNGADLDVGVNSSPAFADVDGDGDLDLYVGGDSGNIEVFTNNNGTFTSAGVLSITGTPQIVDIVGDHSTPAFADIDLDGDLDLYVGGGNGSVALFTNSGGIFTHIGNLQSNGVDINPGLRTNPTFEDMDGDGDLDLMVNSRNSTIKFYTNNGGLFTMDGDVEARDISIDLGENSAPTFADVDGDDDLDLYIGNEEGEIHVFNNDLGELSYDGNLQSVQINGRIATPTFADIDGDGDLDLYVGEYYGNINIFTNNNGSFTPNGNLEADGATIAVTYYAAPAFADIDLDGDLDLYVGEYGKIEVFTNNNGTFSASGKLQAGGADINMDYAAAPTFADVDDDGDLDLYVGNFDGELNVFTNNNGTFAAGVEIADRGRLAKPAFADLDGDGDLDLYLGNNYGVIWTFTNTTSVGVKDISFDNLNVSPNPTKGLVNITLENEEINSIKIVDLLGRTMKHYGNETQIDVSDMNTGVYFLEISNDEKRSIVKLVVE